ncbi:MAG: hypothetical protein QGG48_00900, partial [Desulfatiglandales bacterium]|nr:hypothetical protein [Desulfatiglandales bacterium]
YLLRGTSQNFQMMKCCPNKNRFWTRVLKSEKHSPTFYKGMWDILSIPKVWTGHFINKKKDGTLYRVEGSISPTKDSTNKIINYAAVQRDVTDEIRLEWQLRQAQRMEAIGTLAGGIAHDFNNPIRYYGLYRASELRCSRG